MSNMVYSVNDEVFATKDAAFGWVVKGTLDWTPSEYHPIETRFNTLLDLPKLKKLRTLYSLPVYPEDLKRALDDAITRMEQPMKAYAVTVGGVKKDLRDLPDHMDLLRLMSADPTTGLTKKLGDLPNYEKVAGMVKAGVELDIPVPDESEVPYKCGYCGSTNPLVSPEEAYGPGATGWPCCPDCHGV